MFRRVAAASAFVLVSIFLLSPSGRAQFSTPESAYTQVHDAAALRPPAGAHVAIIEFEDLQCPDCRRANPIVEAAAKKFHIPVVRHDFPLPFHTWSFQAAVDARWFDTHSRQLGHQFRDAVFAAQPTIKDHKDLQAFAARFARQHGLSFPANPDPNGKLREMVKADYELGLDIGVKHTPTIWVVTNQTTHKPFIEVLDRSHLDALIQKAEAETREASNR